MKLQIIFVVLIILISSCKASREKKACFKLVGENKILDIKNFDELKEYTGAYWVKFLNTVWILDGKIISEDEIRNKANEKEFNVLKVELIDGDSIKFSCKRVSSYILISTNNCLKKY